MKILLILIFCAALIMPVTVHQTGLSGKHPLGMKMLCSFMFLFTGIVSLCARESITVYSVSILTALVFGVLGDFFLSYKNERYFLSGVIFFALGHLVYILTFLFQGEPAGSTAIIAISVVTLIFVTVLYFFSKAKLELKKMQLPLVMYAGILFVSFCSVVVRGILLITEGKFLFGTSVISGAVLFIFSDILLGISIGGMKLPKMLKHGVSYSYFPAQTFFAISIFLQE